MNFFRKLLPWLVRATLGALLLGIFLLAAIYWILQRDPDELAGKYLAELSARTGLEFSFGPVDVSLLPMPTIALSEINVQGKDIDFSVAWLNVRPDFLKMLTGNFTPRAVSLIRPRFSAKTALPLVEPAKLSAELAKIFPEKDGNRAFPPPWLTDCSINLINAEASISGTDNQWLKFQSFNWQMEFFTDGYIAVLGRLGAVRAGMGQEIIFSLENFQLAGETNLHNTLQKTSNLKSSGNLRIKGLLKDFNFTLDADSAIYSLDCRADLNATLDLAGAPVEASIAGAASIGADGRMVRFKDIALQLGHDHGILNAALAIAPGHADFQLDGQLDFQRLSLTQWLGFARNLAPGLQLALDNVTDGHLDFSLSPHGLLVTKASAACSGAIFSGTGSVADFSKPVVFLDLKSPRANLGLAIPEALGKSPVPPEFANPPLTPMPGVPLKPGETGIGYDIRLGADKVDYGPLLFTNAFLRIHPGKMDKIGLEDVLLTATGTLYGGKVKGECILGADPSLPSNIVVSADNINGANLGKSLPAFPFRQGIFDASANINSRGKQLDPFLKNLKGKISASGQKIVPVGQKETFASMTARANLRSARMTAQKLAFDGQWNASARNQDFSASAEMDGILSFDREGMEFKNIPGKISAVVLRETGPLPKNTEITLRGNMTFNPGQTRFAISDATFDALGAQASGNLGISVAKDKLSWDGSLRSKRINTASVFKHLNFSSIEIPPAFRTAALDATFSGTPENTRLKDIKAEFGKTTVTGWVDYKTAAKPTVDFALSLNTLELASGGNSSTPKTSAQNWNFTFLRNFDAKGQIKVKKLHCWDLQFENVTLPLKMAGGVMDAGPLSARFYGAPLNSSAHLVFGKGVNFRASIAVHDFDLGSAARDRKLATLLTGRGNIDANLKADLTGPGQLTGALDGTWKVSATNGSWQGKNKNGNPTGRPTSFSLLKCSGKIAGGRVESSDFTLRGPTMNVTGSGWANLVTKKIDCNFNVSMSGLPDFPLYLYGNLDKPKTSIGAGKMVVNAITDITSGFVDILGNIAEGAWKIFR